MSMVVRCANIHDLGHITKIFVESWQSTYAGILSENFLFNLSGNGPKTFWRNSIDNPSMKNILLVAEDSDAGVIGFVSGGKPRIGSLGMKSEIYELYLLDSFQGLGIGRHLFSKAAKQLHVMFGISLLVWVVEKNPSRFFYERLGGKKFAIRREKIAGTEIQQFCYIWENTNQFVDFVEQKRS